MSYSEIQTLQKIAQRITALRKESADARKEFSQTLTAISKQLAEFEQTIKEIKISLRDLGANDNELVKVIERQRLDFERIEDRYILTQSQSKEGKENAEDALETSRVAISTANQAIQSLRALGEEVARMKREMLERINFSENLLTELRVDIEKEFARYLSYEEFKDWQQETTITEQRRMIEEASTKREKIAAYWQAFISGFTVVPAPVWLAFAGAIGTVGFDKFQKLIETILALLGQWQ